VLTLTNDFLQFGFDPDGGDWNIQPRDHAGPRLAEARLGASYEAQTSDGSQTVYWNGELHEPQVADFIEPSSVHGRLQGLTIAAKTSVQEYQSLAVSITFALPEKRPFLLWRIVAHNGGGRPLKLGALDLLRVGPHFEPGAAHASLPFGLAQFFRRDSAEKLHPRPDRPDGRLNWGTAGPSDSRAARLAFFSNGYQSWSFAGALQAHAHQPSSIFGWLHEPKVLNLVTARFRRAGWLTSDMFGVLGNLDADVALVAGFVSQREQFSSVEVQLDPSQPSLRLTAQCDDVDLAPGAERSTDWAYLQFVKPSAPDPLAEYADAVARDNQARVPRHTPVGWCSWYHYFDKVTEVDLLANLEAIAGERDRLPLDFVQLDDGFQAQVGDWFQTKPTFAHGLRWLAAEIRGRGHSPGLWLAPFMVRSDAQLLRDHPDWFLRDAGGRLVNAGFNWFRWCYGLDPTHPAVREHVRRLIATAVQDWGYDYLKLDFLYAAALPARRHDPSLTRAQAMRMALDDVRQAAGPDTFLLGCGCPLGSAVGVVDGMRISTDVAPEWHPQLFTPRLAQLVQRETDFAGVRNAIRNTINRAPLHRRWWLNDPDCLLVRDYDTHLTEAEVRSLATVIALSGGIFLTSDDMSRLRPERQRYIAALLPVLGAGAQAPGWLESDMPDVFVLRLSGAGNLGEWTVAGVFNWTDETRERVLAPAKLGLDQSGDYFVSDFWDADWWILPGGQPLRLKNMAAHSARLLAIRRRRLSVPNLVSSSFHFSQGGEISAWVASDHQLQATLNLGRVADGEIRLALPAAPLSVMAGQGALSPVEAGDGIYSLLLTVNRTETVYVSW
jgi:alpha-galactosidase